MRFISIFIFSAFLFTSPIFAGNSDVYIVVNSKSKDSKAIGKYYAEVRDIPLSNIIELSIPEKDPLSRKEYQTALANPLVEELIKRGAVSATEISKDKDTFRPSYLYVSQKVKFLVLCRVPFRIWDTLASAASVDSELSSTFLPMKSINGQIRNPLYKNYTSPEVYKTYGVLRVARLDGKNFSEAKVIIDSAIYAEKNGARGRAYIDKNTMSGAYKIGNDWISAAENELRKLNFDLSVDSASALMGHDKRFDAPLFYFGWYSGNPQGYFIEKDFKSPSGAVGLHLYSFSASHLRRSGWTTILMRDAFAQSFGNVYEPYLTGTQNMGALMEAYSAGMSAGEAAYASIPVLSWRSLVVGDPLYKPFDVSLEEQIKRIESGRIDDLSQYSIIRQMNKMKANGVSVSERLRFAKKYENAMPNIALRWKIAEEMEAMDDKDSVREILLKLYFEKIWRNPNFVGLSMELAEKFSNIEEFSVSMDIYDKLGELDMSDEFYRVVVNSASALSKKRGLPLSDKFLNLKKKFDALDAAKKAEQKATKK